MEKKAIRFSVGDFLSNADVETSAHRHFIISADNLFPASFTINQPSILNGVAFCICVSGGATIKINSRTYLVDPDTVITILPNHIVEPIGRTDDLKLHMLVFSLEMITNFHLNIAAVQAVGANPCIKATPQDKDILLDMCALTSKLCAQTKESEAVVTQMVHTLLMQIGATYTRSLPLMPGAPTTRPEELTEQFLRLLVEYFRKERSPAFYAGKLCITPKYLSQIVKEMTGETVFEWINKIVMLGAKNMLHTSDFSVLQISEELNFPNPSFFGRYFKKHAGVTPIEFRKRLE